jgi:hypothetical protein
VGSDSVHEECQYCFVFPNRITTAQLRFQLPQRCQQRDAGALHALRLQFCNTLINQQETGNASNLNFIFHTQNFEFWSRYMVALSRSQNITAETLKQE